MFNASSLFRADLNRYCAAGIFIFAVLAFTSFSASAMDLPLAGAGAKIQINFADAQQSKFVFVGNVPGPANLNLNGMTVALSLGGVQRMYTLSPDGQGVGTPDLFQIRPVGPGYTFIVSTQDNSLAAAYQPLQLTNQNSNNVTITVPASINFNGQNYVAMLQGSYYAHANDTGRGYVGVILPPADPFAVAKHITSLLATPNPTQINTPVTIKGAISLKNFNGDVAGTLNFGDMSPPIHANGTDFQKMLKKGLSHPYTAEGVYVARVVLIGGDEIADTRLFIIVGDGYVVNSANGAAAKLVKSAGGMVSLQLLLNNVPSGMNAQTQFMDMNHNVAGMPPGGPPPQGGQIGLAPANIFTLPGIYVAEAMALDMGGNPLGKLRKSIAIGAKDVALSGGTKAESGDKQAAPRDTSTDNPITLTSMSGTFIFNALTPDKVVFNGSVALPLGYTPKDPLGNDLTISLGNVSDTVHLDSKSKFDGHSTLGYITKFTIKLPRIPGGVVTDTKTAKISVTMNTTGLILMGFDSEGIETTVRADEDGETAVARFIQVDMLIGDSTYSGLIQVSYTTVDTNDFGTISTRSVH